MVSGKQQTSKKYLQQGYRKHKKNRKILELKNTMTELKTSVERINISCSMWDLVPDQRANLGTLSWELEVLATGLPGKPLSSKDNF